MVLQALHKLNPSGGPSVLNKDLDYPRKRLVQYEDDYVDHEALVVKTTWELDNTEILILEKAFGEHCLNSKEICILKFYGTNEIHYQCRLLT